MNWNIIILIIGLAIAVAVFLFGQGILRRTKEKKIVKDKEKAVQEEEQFVQDKDQTAERKDEIVEEENYIFCAIQQIKLEIPSSLRDRMKSILGSRDELYIHNILVKNEAYRVCMNPVITIRYLGDIFGHVVNDTNEDKKQMEGSIETPEKGRLAIKPKRLGSNSFVDLTVWSSNDPFLDENAVSFSSDGNFRLRTKFISHYNWKDVFE